ncbi:hypothetical protein [Phytohabitans rumicis]|uniref:Lipoprotein n=1 Tax=Phytohabitans rumicis TaxID=1076125 RepID=A0A6V8L412_9ACTN|nr:hypothetical protein [Phytohabitans rumicis]GFJ89379.1 hypothetical protein Prum_030210 [Phytohabitans rumicis]
MTRTRAAIVAAGITLSFLLAGCGGDEAPAVATAATGGPTASASPGNGSGSVAEYVEAQRKWVACMREQGFDFPDPDAKGQIHFSDDDNRKNKANPQNIAAQEACEQFQMEVPAALEPEEEPATPEQIANRREYAKCMRENGQPDYPDPDANGNFPQNWGSGEASPQEQAVTIRAMQICDPVLQGRPEGTPNPNATYQG